MADLLRAHARAATPDLGLASLQRKCACEETGDTCERCARRRRLQRRADRPPPGAAIPPIVEEVLQQPGRPLDDGPRRFMETRLAHDFTTVRVHDGDRAANASDALNAAAYTFGDDVVFGRGHYAPGTPAGVRLLAHELAHVAQQQKATRDPTRTVSVDAAEREAAECGSRVAAGRNASVAGARPVGISLQPLGEEEKIRRSLGLEPRPQSAEQTVHWLGTPPAWLAKQPEAPVVWLGPQNRKLEKSVERSRTQTAKKPEAITDLLPRPRTTFEAWAFKQNMRRKMNNEGQIVGFLKQEGGLSYEYDIYGKATVIGEAPLEPPLIDPIDVIPFELIGSLSAKAALTVGKVALKGGGRLLERKAAVTLAESSTRLGVNEAVKTAASKEAAGGLLEEAASSAVGLEKSAVAAEVAGGEVPAVTPLTHRLPPHVESPQQPVFARNVGSHGESVIEPRVLSTFFRKARLMSAKALGFDAMEKEVITHVTKKIDKRTGLIVVEEGIKGGHWIQIKKISSNLNSVKKEMDTAMQKIFEAKSMIESGKLNKFERMSTTHAYRTRYMGMPDQITIFLYVEEGSATGELKNAAEAVLKGYGEHTAGMPRINIAIGSH